MCDIRLETGELVFEPLGVHEEDESVEESFVKVFGKSRKSMFTQQSNLGVVVK